MSAARQPGSLFAISWISVVDLVACCGAERERQPKARPRSSQALGHEQLAAGEGRSRAGAAHWRANKRAIYRSIVFRQWIVADLVSNPALATAQRRWVNDGAYQNCSRRATPVVQPLNAITPAYVPYTHPTDSANSIVLHSLKTGRFPASRDYRHRCAQRARRNTHRARFAHSHRRAAPWHFRHDLSDSRMFPAV